jgi:hypothetical protein
MADGKGVLIVLDIELHAAVKAIADRYGASVRGTLVRFAREGVEREAKRQTEEPE